MLIQEQISNILSAFEPINLKEMDTVELMNRTDTKYVFNLQLLPEILNEAKSRYRVLEINNDRFFTYKTTYYDTPDYKLFNNHVLGRLNRHKIRHRTYESTGVSYLEVKFKSNKDRTIKWRIKNDINGSFDKMASEFLFLRTHMNSDNLLPVVTNHFTRITLVSIADKTRVTLDYGLSFKGNCGTGEELPYVAIAEIKQEGYNNNNFFVKLLKKYGIRKGGFSKYCIGSAMLYTVLRKNSLKPNLLLLNRIKNLYDINALANR